MVADSPLPKRLKAARLHKGLSQKALGIAAGMDEFGASARVNQYERGVHAPSYNVSRQLARALDVPTAYLYADDEFDANLLLATHSLGREERRKLLAELQQAGR